MNRKVLFAIILVISIVLTGCGDKGASSEIISETEEEPQRPEFESEDPEFWKSATNMADVIAETVGDEGNFSICFKLSFQDSTESTFEAFYVDEQPTDEEDQIELSNRIIYDLMIADPVDEAHQRGESVELAGVILRWADSRSKEEKGFSACDLPGDGTWDYVCEGALVFADHGGALTVLEDADGNPITIDEIESKKVKLVQIEKPTLEDLVEVALS